ncbi:hypothetical protein EDM56_10170 [Brevibacillus fluminis]|uniref:Fibronectin type-III domain-containing protein n=1 Tax=Brevibacillus fluminis TaxID=511487 RepID=A0A3M8DN99_9BACL|nr:M4 family metallopeptidase [Brevibacillus fluminis]RNB89548.1 hypothetical protein EDM56_10170 [Brevibacillus fluminis]
MGNFRRHFLFIRIIMIIALVCSSFGWTGSKVAAKEERAVLSKPLQTDQDVLDFLTVKRKVARVSGEKSQLTLLKKQADEYGNHHYLYQQTYQGIPVYGKYVQVHLDEKRRVYSVRDKEGDSGQKLNVDTTPKLSAKKAVSRFQKELEKELKQPIKWDARSGTGKASKPSTELLIYPFKGKTYLAYRIKLSYYSPTIGSWVGFVNADTGEVIDKYSNLQHEDAGGSIKFENAVEGTGQGEKASRKLNVYQDKEGALDPNSIGAYYLLDITKQMWQQGTEHGSIETLASDGGDLGTRISSPTGEFTDSDAVDAHFNAGVVYDFYQSELNRNSFDNKGTSIQSVVHYEDYPGEPMDNAFFDESTGAMYYGDGSTDTQYEYEYSMKCLSCSLDVVAHEITHGVTAYTAELEYRDQSGALNESISDILGELIEKGVEKDSDWQIGEETGLVLRDMENPGKYDQPAHMNDYQNLPYDYDNGGVHINSGIPNHAAYLIATKAVAAGLDGKDLLLHTTYNALFHLTSVSKFEDAREAFLLGASEYAQENALDSALVEKIVDDAWKQVGIGLNPTRFTFRPDGRNVDSIDPTESIIRAFVPYETTDEELKALEPVIELPPGMDYAPKGKQDFTEALHAEPVKYTITNQVGYSRIWNVYIERMPGIEYYSEDFYESYVNDGSLFNPITMGLDMFTFRGRPGDDLIQLNRAAVRNLPEGLTAKLILTRSTNTAELRLFGKVKSHEKADNTSIEVEFFDDAFDTFQHFQAKEIPGSINSDIQLHFSTPITSFVSEGHDDTSASFSWSPPPGAEKYYIVQMYDDGEIDKRKLTNPEVDSSSVTVDYLEPNQSYTFCLLVKGGDNEGFSNPVTVTTGNDTNHAPVVASPIRDQSLTAGQGSIQIDAGNTFTDADARDNLTLFAKSDTPAVANVSMQNNTITMTPVSAGKAKITVTAEDSKGAQAQTQFTVTVSSYTPPTPSYYPVTSVSLNKTTLTLKAGGDGERLVASIQPSNATNQQVVWTSSEPTVASVDPNGKVTPLVVGEATVTVTTVDGNKTASARVKVEPKETILTGMRASESSILLKPSEEKELTIYGVYSDGTEKDITHDPNAKYRTSASSIATAKQGLITAGKKEGKAVITVRYEGKRLEIPVTVSKEVPKEIKRVTPSKRSVRLEIDKTQAIKLTAYYKDGSKEIVTQKAEWTSDAPAVATVKDGVITALAEGKATITATIQNQKVTIRVTVIGK